jgi:hypothetical protein
MPKRKVSEPDPEQYQRFVEAARELGCDESEERFVEVVRKVAAPKSEAPSEPSASAAKRSHGGRRKP